MSTLEATLLEGEANDPPFTASLKEPAMDRVRRNWRTSLGALYLLGMGMCSVVLCALGATLENLAGNVGLSSLDLSSVYIARGAGSLLGAMACATTFRLLHGNHVIAGTLAALSGVLLILPRATNVALLHFLFSLLGIMTATIDTGVQIMTRKAHREQAGPWLGANTLAFGVAGSLVPLVSLLSGNNMTATYIVFAAYALFVASGLLALVVPPFMGVPEEKDFKHPVAARKAGKDAGSAVSYGVERTAAVVVFLVIGGQVAVTSYTVTYISEVWGGDEGEGMVALSLLWVAITAGRVAGLARQVYLSRRCDELDAAASLTGSKGPSAHMAPEAVNAVLFDLKCFLGTASLGGILMVGAGQTRWVWVAGLLAFGAGNGPALGMVYDFAHRTTQHSESGTAVIMVGLNLGASLVPWAAAKIWSLADAPVALSIVALVTVVLPLPILYTLIAHTQEEEPIVEKYSFVHEANNPLALELDNFESNEPLGDESSHSLRSSIAASEREKLIEKRAGLYKKCWWASVVLVVCAAAGMMVSIAKIPDQGTSSGGVHNATTAEDDGDDSSPAVNDDGTVETPLGMAASSDYIDSYGPIGEDYPWVTPGTVVVVDVGKTLTLVATGVREGCDVTWEVDSGRVHHASDPAVWMGVFSTVGMYPASVSERCPGDTFGSDIRTTSGTVVATWVRRELRELTSTDLAKVMDAMAICYNTSTAEGQARYGSGFVGLDTFQLWHHLNSAQRDADHFHQGVGFLAQHAKITRLFELSLQAVDPTIAMPFWDSSIEMAQFETGAIDSVWHSALWSPAMFGSVKRYLGDTFDDSDPVATAEALFGDKALNGTLDDTTMREWAIQDGRFAFFQLPKRNMSELPVGTPRNAYGHLRAPWNNNPSPYVTRYPQYANREGKIWGNFPSCEVLNVFALEEREWTSTAWMYGVSNKPHGSMHSGPGGTAILRVNEELVDLVGDKLAEGVRQHTLWRFRRLNFPLECALNASVASCRPTCNTNLWSYEDMGYEILKSQIFLPSEEDLAGWKADPSFLEDVGRTYCNGTQMDMSISGDAKDSGGCVDPSFWPIHGAIERLYQYRILKGPGFSTDPTNKWPTKHTCFGARSNNFDPDRLCYLSEAYDNPDNGTPTPGNDTTCCGGHHKDGRIYASYPKSIPAYAPEVRRRKLMHHDDDGPFGSDDGSEDASVGSVGPPNQEMLQMMNPLVGPNFNYPVYHHFKWDHCAAVGQVFP